VVVDIPPAPTASSSFVAILTAMKSLDLDAITTRKEAETFFRDTIKDNVVRQFLLTNLVHSPDHKLKWRCNLEAISNNLQSLMGFPVIATASPYTKRSIFLCGENSGYVRDEHISVINKLFPSTDIVYLKGAGHWPHFEKPREVVDIVGKFLINR
jgi:pimeloyl-ACP methyl ester carboxylesterase